MRRFALAMMMVAAAFGQQQPQPDSNDNGSDNGDAPDRGVARISFINGNASVRRGDSGELVDAVLNAPLTATDRVVTAEGSRAEVQFDSANLIRLGPATEVRLSELAYGRFQIQVAVGTTSFRVLRDSNAQVELSTPSVSVRPTQKGIYRITVRPDGSSEITVRQGNAEIFSPRGSQELHSGQTMMARGSATDPEFQVTGQLPQDDLDRWSSARDHDLERASSPRYVSPDVYGTEDLDGHGRWANDPQYGDVWVPAVDPGWAPYRCGRWTWIDYYGWTWVGCESWGWAPYHYGNWYWGSLGWAWYPGAIHTRCYWRPAMVGFFGWGGGAGVGFGFGGFGFGNVGWVPLAPFERFHPWYGRGYGGGYRGGINNVTIVNNTNITNVYRNARFNNGITSVRSGEFGHGNVNNGNFVRASSGDLSRAGMVHGQLPLAPSRESTQFSNRAANTQGLPRTNENARFFSRGGTPQQRQGMSQTPTRSLSSAEPAPASNGGWRRFDPSTRGSAQSDSSGQSNGGFRRFDGGNRNESPRTQGAEPSSRSLSPQQGDGGFRRFDGGNRNESPRGQRAEPPSRTFSPPPSDRNDSPRTRNAEPPARSYSPPPQSQQPLRISPPIIQDRGNSQDRANSQNRGSSGGGGGSRGNGGSSPRSGGGESRGGGGSREGGSHGGHR